MIIRCPLPLLLVLAVPAHAGDKPTSAEAAVRERILSHAAAIERRDLSALDALYSHQPDVLIIEGGGVDRGWERYRDHHLKPELEELKELRLRYDNVKAEVTGDLAWATFDYELRAGTADRLLERVGRGTCVLRRIDGAWRIVHLHTSGRLKKKDPAPEATRARPGPPSRPSPQ